MKYLLMMFCVSTLVAQNAKISFQHDLNYCPETHADLSILRDYDPFEGLPTVPFRIELDGIAYDFFFPSNTLRYVARVPVADNRVASHTETRKPIRLIVDRPWILDSSRPTGQLEIVDDDRLGGLISMIPIGVSALGYLTDGSLVTFTQPDRDDYRIDFRGRTSSSVNFLQSKVQLRPIRFEGLSDGGCLVSFSAVWTPIRPGAKDYSILMRFDETSWKQLSTTEEGMLRYRVDDHGRILYWVRGESGNSPLQRLLSTGAIDDSFRPPQVDGVILDFVPDGQTVILLTRKADPIPTFQLWRTYQEGPPAKLISQQQETIGNSELKIAPGGRIVVAHLGLQAPGGTGGGPCWIKRFNADGTVDEQFGDRGTIVFPKSDFVSPPALDLSGNLYVASEPMVGKLLPRRLVRFNSSGQPDPSFLAPDLPFSPGPVVLDGAEKVLALVAPSFPAPGVELRTTLPTRLAWTDRGELDFTEATPGYRYQIQSSTNLVDWKATLGPVHVENTETGGTFFRWLAEW
jgi:hypothetical protein